jgi:hypothetical protein
MIYLTADYADDSDEEQEMRLMDFYRGLRGWRG